MVGEMNPLQQLMDVLYDCVKPLKVDADALSSFSGLSEHGTLRNHAGRSDEKGGSHNSTWRHALPPPRATIATSSAATTALEGKGGAAQTQKA